ncbi:DUF4123 domain-containing protein [Aggregatibacter actinomycetemcomitans]|uniref:DUF4123 domain-containing protein n=1 Tax=Aggregatibacter actinomycetemcomitans TaxID=714 RepID=UPI00067FA46E|nr:DUF4123 domain-containing protein [Aggregatibacter actinomycetemcomitans]TQE41624.1 hypothetical protein SC1000_05120 [Aggregatibacter actinomycetemcomitans]
MSDRESYQQAVETFLSTQNLSGHFQLAALPIQIWFTRHDFSAPLWRLAQQISPENLIILFRENALSVEAITEDTEYLVQESVTFEPFLDIFSKNALPDILKKGFFAELIGLDERHFLTDKEEIPLQLQQTGKHYYAVIDTSKVVAYPSALKGSGQIANLYKGKTGETLEDAAPYLFEFDPGNSGSIMFLQKLFRKMESRVLSHWETNPVIFIRSDKDFDMVYHHLRKFTHLYNPEEEIWYFFRFYDPKVLSACLPYDERQPADRRMEHITSVFNKATAIFGDARRSPTGFKYHYIIFILFGSLTPRIRWFFYLTPHTIALSLSSRFLLKLWICYTMYFQRLQKTYIKT